MRFVRFGIQATEPTNDGVGINHDDLACGGIDNDAQLRGLRGLGDGVLPDRGMAPFATSVHLASHSVIAGDFDGDGVSDTLFLGGARVSHLGPW